MRVKGLLIATLIVVAAMVGFAFWAAGQLPPGTELATHWNAAGQADRTAPALRALLLPAGIAFLLGVVFTVVPFIEPMQDRLEGSAPVLRVSWIGLLVMMAVIQLITAAPAFGFDIGPNFILVILGGLLLVIGNVLPKSRPGFFVGIRTPWTITDTDIWIATHRLGGKLMMAVGAVFLLVAFMPLPPDFRLGIVIAGAIGSALVPVVYSWWLWHRKRKSKA